VAVLAGELFRQQRHLGIRRRVEPREFRAILEHKAGCGATFFISGSRTFLA